MRLLDTATFKLKTFVCNDDARYAVLSHTWGEDEVLFEDVQNTTAKEWTAKAGAAKILNSGIDKSSSAELSEAINSMYRWYERSAICYAYLSDVHVSEFTREDSLQELVAPREVNFYDATWNLIGTRTVLADIIHSTTRIDRSIFNRRPTLFGVIVEDYSIHNRMTWARGRETTRKEDTAYSLMGIFNVNMPLLYGEGGVKAFERLQEEIIKGSNDQSILLHTSHVGPLARSPEDFSSPYRFKQNPNEPENPLQKIKIGFSISLLLYPLEGPKLILGIVESLFEDDPSGIIRPAISLAKETEEGNKYYRKSIDILRVRYNAVGEAEVVDSSDGIVVPSLSYSKLKRTVVTISERYRGRLNNFFKDPASYHIDEVEQFRLYLRPIVHKVPMQLYEYGISYPTTHDNWFKLRRWKSCGDLHLMGFVILRLQEQPGPLLAVLVFADSGHPFTGAEERATGPNFYTHWLDPVTWLRGTKHMRLSQKDPWLESDDLQTLKQSLYEGLNALKGDSPFTSSLLDVEPMRKWVVSGAVVLDRVVVTARVEESFFLESKIYNLNIEVVERSEPDIMKSRGQ
ncbi:hypothetical protein F5Y19DRAFT_481944 [Xylariaceae sp. FL1651]|nr:hypothetical protein F5Y19DRAFT_481944 [Xylariaceae sp. FL1651]